MNKIKILVIDDDSSVRELTVDILDALGYESIQADDGTTGLEAYKQNTDISIVLSDMNMKEMDGDKLTDAIRAYEVQTQSGRRAEIAIITGLPAESQPRLQRLLQEDTIYATLIKPYLMADIEKVVEEGVARLKNAYQETI